MTTSDLLRFATGGMRGHRLRTILSLTGVAIGVASVILLTSLGEGARLYVTGEFSSLGSNLVILLPGKTETLGASPLVSAAPNDLSVADVAAIAREVRGVRRTAPISLGTAAVAFGDRSRDAVVIGTTRDNMEIRHLRMAIGRYLPAGETDTPVCVLGAKVERELFRGGNPLGETVRIGDSRFRVIGVIAARGTSIGMNMDEVVYLPVESGLRLFNRTGLFRGLVEVRSPGEIPSVVAEVRRLLTERHGGTEDFTVLTQDAVLSTFNKILGMLTAVLGGIAAISLAVAGIGIMNVMLVSVSERTSEIGLLKAIGVTNRQVTAVFLVEATLISFAGGLIGLGLGLGAAQTMRRIWPDFPLQPPVWAVVSALVVSIVIGLSFGGVPARRAAACDPVQALLRRRA